MFDGVVERFPPRREPPGGGSRSQGDRDPCESPFHPTFSEDLKPSSARHHLLARLTKQGSVPSGVRPMAITTPFRRRELTSTRSCRTALRLGESLVHEIGMVDLRALGPDIGGKCRAPRRNAPS